MNLIRSRFLQAVLILVVAFCLLRFGIRPPAPYSVIKIYMLVVCLAVLPAVGVMLLHNRAVTGSWTTMPYVLSQYQYGVPAALTFQPDPAPRFSGLGRSKLPIPAVELPFHAEL